MSKIPINFKLPAEYSFVYNGTRAAANVLSTTANGVYAQSVCVAAASYTLTNAPVLRAITPASTSHTYQSTLKIRADVPINLEDNAFYTSGTKVAVKASATVVLYNSSAEPQYITIPTAYQGVPATTATYWKLENLATIYIPALSCVTFTLNGSIHPEYRNNAKITDADLNYIFFDAKTTSSASAIYLLYFAMYLMPMAGIDSAADVMPLMIVNAPIVSNAGVQNYLDKLYDCNSSFNMYSHGTLAPVDQYTNNYGFSLNAYYATRKYHLFMPNTTYDSTTETRGSLYLPLRGQGLLGSDGNYKYNIRLNWYSRISVNATCYYYPIYFLPDSTSGVALSQINQAQTANTDYLITGTYTISSATPLTGISIAPRVQRTGSTGNVYIYTSNFSAKVLPYPQYY